MSTELTWLHHITVAKNIEQSFVVVGDCAVDLLSALKDRVEHELSAETLKILRSEFKFFDRPTALNFAQITSSLDENINDETPKLVTTGHHIHLTQSEVVAGFTAIMRSVAWGNTTPVAQCMRLFDRLIKIAVCLDKAEIDFDIFLIENETQSGSPLDSQKVIEIFAKGCALFCAYGDQAGGQLAMIHHIFNKTNLKLGRYVPWIVGGEFQPHQADIDDTDPRFEAIKTELRSLIGFQGDFFGYLTLQSPDLLAFYCGCLMRAIDCSHPNLIAKELNSAILISKHKQSDPEEVYLAIAQLLLFEQYCQKQNKIMTSLFLSPVVEWVTTQHLESDNIAAWQITENFHNSAQLVKDISAQHADAGSHELLI